MNQLFQPVGAGGGSTESSLFTPPQVTPRLQRMLAMAGDQRTGMLRYIGPQYYDQLTQYQQGLLPTAGFF
jgi:hypothetical protein